MSGIDIRGYEIVVLHGLNTASGRRQGIHSVIPYIINTASHRHLARSKGKAVVMSEDTIDGGLTAQYIFHGFLSALLSPVAKLR